MKNNFLSLLLFLFPLFASAQQSAVRDTGKREAVQISGVVITRLDSLPQGVPFAHVSVLRSNRGTISNAEGFFSFAVWPGDTVQISSIGFKKEKLYVPDTLSEREYLARVVLERDTTILEEVTLYPWPTPDRFKDEFLAMQIPTTDNDIAMRNLAIQELKSRAEEMGYSAVEMQDFMIQQRQADIYNYGRYQGIADGGTAILGSLTNPFAWAEFFKAIKRGDFKSRK